MLSKVRVCTPEQLLDMSHEQANPKNAVVGLLKGSFYLSLFHHVCINFSAGNHKIFSVSYHHM